MYLCVQVTGLDRLCVQVTGLDRLCVKVTGLDRCVCVFRSQGLTDVSVCSGHRA